MTLIWTTPLYLQTNNQISYLIFFDVLVFFFLYIKSLYSLVYKFIMSRVLLYEPWIFTPQTIEYYSSNHITPKTIDYCFTSNSLYVPGFWWLSFTANFFHSKNLQLKCLPIFTMILKMTKMRYDTGRTFSESAKNRCRSWSSRRLKVSIKIMYYLCSPTSP